MKIKIINRYFILFSIALCVYACKETYTPPPVTNGASNTLVVEGMINISADSTLIRLSRTVKLTDTTSLKPELNAALTVESDGGAAYGLAELGNGKYFAVGHPLATTNKYRLHIKTTDGKEYLSDYIVAKPSPPIDSVSWKALPDKLEIYATTHDPNSTSTYYKYNYTDAWEFHAAFESQFKVENNTILPRSLPQDDIYTCWSGSTSTLINLASSAKLSQDVIYQNKVITIPTNSEKISVRYSILVSQQVLTKEAFDYYTDLQKNTEKLGSIFDAQPSVLSSNIHNVNDAKEIVVGFLSVGTTTSKRIFITKAQLPSNYDYGNPLGCGLEPVYYMNPGTGELEVQNYILTKVKLPISSFLQPGTGGFVSTKPICGDCTIRGTKKKPSFW